MKRGWGDFVPINQDLADMLGRMDFDFDNFVFGICCDPKCPDFQVPRFPNFQNPSCSDFWTPAAAIAAMDKLSDANLTLFPMHPGIKYSATSH